MASTKIIRNRIRAIRNTAKITHAMEMVAASKMKRAQQTTLKNRPYSLAASEVIANLSRGQVISHPFLATNEKATKNLLIVVTSDKGLCGSYNSAIIKLSSRYLKENDCDLITIGKKGQNWFRRLNKNIIATFIDFPIYPRSYDIRPIIHTVSENYRAKNYKEVVCCYTDFESTLKQTPLIKKMLPMGVDVANGRSESEATIKFEPSAKEVINFLIPRILETQFFQMLLESIASEQSARMVAMKNATDAADDLIDDLNLTYNSLRQSSITQELAEISAGAFVKKG